MLAWIRGRSSRNDSPVRPLSGHPGWNAQPGGKPCRSQLTPQGCTAPAGSCGLSRHTAETRAATGHRVAPRAARAHCSHGCHRALTCAPKPGIRYPRQWNRSGSGSVQHGESHSRTDCLRASNNCRKKNAFRLNARRRPGSNAVARRRRRNPAFPSPRTHTGSELPPGGAGALRSHGSTHSQHAERHTAAAVAVGARGVLVWQRRADADCWSCTRHL